MSYFLGTSFNVIYKDILTYIEEYGRLLGKSKSISGLYFKLQNPKCSLIEIRKNWLWCLLEGLSRFTFEDPFFLNPGIAYNYRPNWKKKLEAEGGLKFDYSYGDIYCGQIEQIIKKIRKGYREAVISVWDSRYLNDRKYKRRPCTLTHHFFLDDIGLHLNTFMRTNDVMNLLPYDVFHHTLLQRYIATEIGSDLGDYNHFSGQAYYQKKRDITGSVRNAITKLEIIHNGKLSEGSFGEEEVTRILSYVKLMEEQYVREAYENIIANEIPGNYSFNYSIALLYLYIKKHKTELPILFYEVDKLNLNEFNVIKL